MNCKFENLKMAVPPTLEEIIANVSVAVKSRYCGNENAPEIKERVADLLSFSTSPVKLISVSGSPERFQAKLKTCIKSGLEAKF